MPRKNIILCLAASLLIGLYLIPTLINTGTFNKLPSPFIILFVVLPIISFIGILIAYLIGKKIALLWQLSKFALVGVLNTAIDFGILNFLSGISQVTKGFWIIPINATSVSIAMVNSFYWNKDWVFSSHKKASFTTFIAITLIGLGINTGTVFVLTTFVPALFGLSDTLWTNLAKVLATVFSLVWNFSGYKLVVFKK